MGDGAILWVLGSDAVGHFRSSGSRAPKEVRTAANQIAPSPMTQEWEKGRGMRAAPPCARYVDLRLSKPAVV